MSVEEQKKDAPQKIYTLEYCLKAIDTLLKEVKTNKDIIHIWELFEDKPYHHNRYLEWLKEYKDNEEIKEKSWTIKAILESRVVTKGMKDELNATMAIFNLKNNYGYKDKSEVDNKNINYDTKSPEEYQSLTNKELDEERNKLLN